MRIFGWRVPFGWLVVMACACGNVHPTLPDPDGGGGDGASGNTVRLTITLAGEGAGTVSSEPAGVACDGTDSCEATFDANTTVTLVAQPAAGSVFRGWQGGGCASDMSCTLTLDADTTVIAHFEVAPNLVFVTSTLHTGDFGGVAGADAICAARATAAGLSGTYRAWISGGGTAALARLQGARGWVRVDGAPVIDRPEDFAQGRLLNPIRIDELGNDVAGTNTLQVFTGSNADGTESTSTCNNWSTASGSVLGAFGMADYGGDPAVNRGSVNCSASHRLYCFGTDRNATIAPVQPNGRLAFVTTASWKPGGGIASADALCQSEAAASQLPGTYKALLATTTTSLVSRFDVTGAPWHRVDGVRLSETAERFFSRPFLDSFLNLTADGATYYGLINIWTGSNSMTVPGAGVNDTCADWVSTGNNGRVGTASATQVAAFLVGSLSTTTCASVQTKLACLQE